MFLFVAEFLAVFVVLFVCSFVAVFAADSAGVLLPVGRSAVAVGVFVWYAVLHVYQQPVLACSAAGARSALLQRRAISRRARDAVS